MWDIGAPGVYRFYATTQINPWESRTSPIATVVIGADQNWGRPNCVEGVHKPVNVTNGNMYLDQSDHVLRGPGDQIEITRSYNSLRQLPGLFGWGWTTQYDERISVDNDLVSRLHSSDGRVVYFSRNGTSEAYVSASPLFHGQLVKNGDNTFTLNFKDGRVHQFSSVGKLLWQKDRNNNQTTLNYNTSGVLTGVTDAVGRTLSLSMNTDGFVASISDSLGTIATYEYFPGTVVLKTVTYNDGSKYKFEYAWIAGNPYMTSVKDALDNVLEAHAYDSQGRATTSEEDGGISKYTFDYSTAGMTQVTDALARVTKFYFNPTSGRNVVKKVDGVCGCGGSGSEITEFEYDWKLNLTKRKDALGRETTYTYDAADNLASVTDPLGAQSYTYNTFGQVLTSTDRMNGVTTNTYDVKGNLLTSTDPLNNVSTMTYTTRGQLATFKDALNNTTTLTWNTAGQLGTVKDANLKTTTFTYDTRGRLATSKNALNQTTTYAYDLNNRLNKITFPDTNFVSAIYDLAGRRTSITNELGNVTTYGYDNAYRLTSVTDPLTHATTFGYDLMSNMTSKTDALGNVTNLEYDDFDRVKKVKYPLPTVGGTRLEENYTYDLAGNLKTKIDTAGRTTAYDYDNSDRLIKTTDPLLQVTEFEYNARSQMTRVTDAAMQQYDFTYDPLGRMLTETRAGETMSFTYDAVGNRKTRTDYNGRVSQYTYDVLNRLTKIEYGNPVGQQTAKTYTYDVLHRLLTAVNEAGTVSFTYDNRSRLKTETDVFGHLLTYTYDAASRRTVLKLDTANLSTYTYDVANNLKTVKDVAANNTVTYTYDNADRMISRAFPNTVTSTYTYDGMSRLTRLKDAKGATTLFDRQYQYNAANQISQITEPAQTRIFGYDNTDRLTSVANGGSGESYVFDSVGNRTASHRSSTYGYQPFNKISSTQTATYGSDANGNMTGKTDTSGAWTYTWDFENRLSQAAKSTGNVAYTYDALGRRVKRTQGSTVEKYTHDGQDVILDDVNATLTKYQNGPGIDNKLKLVSGATSKYFLSDHLGTTDALTGSTGTVTDSNGYDSFGNPTNTAFASRYQFTGREFDSFSGLQFSRARFYDPNLGRFVSEDPIGFFAGDVNLYVYVKNKPVMLRDPSGLQAGQGVINNPDILRTAGQIITAAGATIAAAGAVIASSPAAVAVAGLAAGATIGYPIGTYTASHPSNPFVKGPLNPFGNPYPITPPLPTTLRPPTTLGGPVCRPAPRTIPIPWTRSRVNPFPIDPPDRSGCPEEISACHQMCVNNATDQDFQGRFGGSGGVYGGSYEACMSGCIPEHCKQGTGFR